ncbi:Crp/Fnr family transcriptional regulator [Sphingobacterium pedocola]|uniref:Cyclic nucleotide-binding domain-containing protein n=1 Tax=Sphingobacterium pedocola TaxID=2082722 RepID=A0ABR9T2U2_9SPHI|nr:cyclic nucleotide-binding domain-containing protein [Sphingobacterium pedocola]MBE8719663.1 hypothetical protein [Sphingobacterium pedocola]
MEQTKVYQELKALLSRYRNPSDELLREIFPFVSARTYEAKDLLTQVGEISNRLCLITEGGAAAYKTVKSERKLVALWKEGDLIIHAQSALAVKKSDVQIVFLTHSTTIEISNKDLINLRQQNPEMSRYFDHFLADDLQKMSDHVCWLKGTKAEQRVIDFGDNYKLLATLLPEEQKAYYLNMSLRWYQKLK